MKKPVLFNTTIFFIISLLTLHGCWGWDYHDQDIQYFEIDDFVDGDYNSENGYPWVTGESSDGTSNMNIPDIDNDPEDPYYDYIEVSYTHGSTSPYAYH